MPILPIPLLPLVTAFANFIVHQLVFLLVPIMVWKPPLVLVKPVFAVNIRQPTPVNRQIFVETPVVAGPIVPPMVKLIRLALVLKVKFVVLTNQPFLPVLHPPFQIQNALSMVNNIPLMLKFVEVVVFLVAVKMVRNVPVVVMVSGKLSLVLAEVVKLVNVPNLVFFKVNIMDQTKLFVILPTTKPVLVPTMANGYG